MSQPPDDGEDPSRAVVTSPPPKSSRLRRYVILTTGWVFIFLGFIGLFLPILQGVLFLAIGTYLLSLESPWVRRRMERVYKRYPKMAATMDAARLRAANVARRIRNKFK